MTDQERIQQIKARCDAATEGPWPMPDELRKDDRGLPDFYDSRRPVDHEGCCLWPWNEDADMEFAYRAREDIPLLLDLLSQAEAERERLEKALKDVIDTICRPGSTADEVFNIAHLAWLKAKETK